MSPLFIALLAGLFTLPVWAGETPGLPQVTRLKLVVPLEPLAPFDRELGSIVGAFNSSRTDAQVEIAKGGSSFENLRSIIAAHYATDLPDMSIINAADLDTLDALSIVQPLPEAWVASKKLLPAYPAGKCRNGDACSLPFHRSVPVWFFNRELLFKLGQPTDHIPTSWPKLSAFARTYSKKGEAWAVAIPEAGADSMSRWTALGLQPTLTAEALTQWVSRMWENQGSWLPGSPTPEEVTRLFLEQKVVVMLGTLDQYSFLQANASFRIGAILPEGGDLTTFGMDIVVLAKGRNAELAREFLDFLYQPRNSIKLLTAVNSLPMTRMQSGDAAWKKEIAARPVLRAASSRKTKRLSLEKILPQSRDDISRTVWEAVENPPDLGLRPAKLDELRARLQKKLSTNPR